MYDFNNLINMFKPQRDMSTEVINKLYFTDQIATKNVHVLKEVELMLSLQTPLYVSRNVHFNSNIKNIL